MKILTKLSGTTALIIGGVLAFAVTSQSASATLHGYCGTGPTTTCADNNTNSPTSTNPPNFFFAASGGSETGTLLIVFLIPDTATQPGSIGVTGSASGTATLVTGSPAGPYTASSNSGGSPLDAYLGISASPNNPFSGFGAGGVTGYDVYDVNLGSQTIPGTGSPFTGFDLSTSIGLPLDSYIVGFLEVPGAARWEATASSGAILETGTPPPPVPEPSSLMLLGTGALALAGVVRRRFGR